MHRFAATALAFGTMVAVFASSPALAQQDERPQLSEAERTAAARALFEEGMRAVDAREWPRAVDRLRRSLELRASPVVRFNLALACVETGRFVEAGEQFRRVMREAPPDSDAHRLAAEGLAGIEGRAGSLRIEISGARGTVEVELDGQPVPRALIGVEQPADPGVRRVSIHRDGEMLASSEVTVVSGALAAVTLEAPEPIVALDPAPAAPIAERPAGGVESEAWFWTLIAALAIGAGVAIGLAVWASQPAEPLLVGDDGITHMTLMEASW